MIAMRVSFSLFFFHCVSTFCESIMGGLVVIIDESKRQFLSEIVANEKCFCLHLPVQSSLFFFR